MDDKDDKKEQRLKIIALAREQSKHETEQCVTYFQLANLLATYNTNNDIKPSLSGGFIMPVEFLNNMAYGFFDKSFIIFFQPPSFEIFKHLKPVLGWVEDESNSYCIVFSAGKYGEFKLIELRMSFPVLLHKIMNRIRLCNQFTLGCVEISKQNPNAYEMKEILPYSVDFLQSMPRKGGGKKFGYQSFL